MPTVLSRCGPRHQFSGELLSLGAYIPGGKTTKGKYLNNMYHLLNAKKCCGEKEGREQNQTQRRFEI